MKMRNLLLGVFLGLLAVIHSSPIESMTQIPARPEEDVLEEAMTDGFLVDHFLGTSFTTEPPKRNTTIQASRQPSFEVLTEGSGFLENYAKTESPETSTTIQASLQPSFDISSEGSGFLETPTSPITEAPEITTIPASPQPTFDMSLKRSGTTQSYLSPKTESPELSTAFQTSLQPNTDFRAEGSGDSSVSSLITTKTVTTTSTPTSTEQSVQSTTTQQSEEATHLARSFIKNLWKDPNEVISKATGVSTQVQLFHDLHQNSDMKKGHSTPDWIIILGFLIGLAALIILCAAIATRDKWNGPNQTSENKTNASNQKKEEEMQTFLYKEEPKENGKEAEYTVIPLDDIPDHYALN